jgi:hypothetical protein
VMTSAETKSQVTKANVTPIRLGPPERERGQPAHFHPSPKAPRWLGETSVILSEILSKPLV